MAATSPPPAHPPDEDAAKISNERVAQMLQDNMRELSKLALEGKIPDDHIQQLQEFADKHSVKEESTPVTGSTQVHAWLQGTMDERHVSVSSADGDEEDEDTNEGTEDENSLPDPIVSEDALRCVECAWEVVDCFCQHCGLKHSSYDGEDPTYPDTYPIVRETLPRGNTPVNELDLDAIVVPAEYAHREEMYYTLISRGATQKMCIRYKLRFYYELGIIAWADESLFEEFTGDLMEEGDLWQIYLGRRIDLESTDWRGDYFMADLLEEATFYSAAPTGGCEGWETVLTRQGRRKRRVWVTRPIPTTQDVLSDSSSSEIGSDSDDAVYEEENGTTAVGDLVADSYAPPAALFVNEYAEQSDLDSNDSDDDWAECSDLEAGEAAEMVLRDAAWDSDAFFDNYNSSDDSDVGLQIRDENDI